MWARYVIDLCPPIDLVVAHNPTTLDLFRAIDVQVHEATPFDREHHSGTRVRQLMASGETWEPLVPERVASYIKEINGVERVQRLTGRVT